MEEHKITLLQIKFWDVIGHPDNREPPKTVSKWDRQRAGMWHYQAHYANVTHDTTEVHSSRPHQREWQHHGDLGYGEYPVLDGSAKGKRSKGKGKGHKGKGATGKSYFTPAAMTAIIQAKGGKGEPVGEACSAVARYAPVRDYTWLYVTIVATLIISAILVYCILKIKNLTARYELIIKNKNYLIEFKDDAIRRLGAKNDDEVTTKVGVNKICQTNYTFKRHYKTPKFVELPANEAIVMEM